MQHKYSTPNFKILTFDSKESYITISIAGLELQNVLIICWSLWVYVGIILFV